MMKTHSCVALVSRPAVLAASTPAAYLCADLEVPATAGLETSATFSKESR